MNTPAASSTQTKLKPGSTYPIKNLKTMKDFATELNQPLLTKGHSVLIDMTSFQSGVIVSQQGTHVWDSHHVKLPHLNPPPESPNKSQSPPSCWDVTRRALRKLTKGNNSIGDVETAIMSYNSNNKDKWTFDALYYYGRHLHAKDNNLHSLIPKMAKLALNLPTLITQSIPLLQQQQNKAITMSQQQISCLLANAFFCTFPHRNDTKPGSEYANYPTINFSRPGKISQESTEAEGHIPLLQHTKPDGLVTFERTSVKKPQLPKWKKQKKTLRNLHISSEGCIEHAGAGMLQVDFASRYIGGEVLGSGLVQEEIFFFMSPELIVARLFTEKLADNECLKITGPQMYSFTSGYSRTFSWVGPYNDCVKRDKWKRRYRQIVVIDALEFKNPKEQYTKENIKRELNKAFVGFHGNPKTAIATGNWGCDAFNGDPKLKALIQLMAAAVAERDMAYFTAGNKELGKEIQSMHETLSKNNVTVVLRNCRGSRFHSCAFTFVLVTRAITSFHRHRTSTTRTTTAEQMSSRNSSEGVWGCLNHLGNSGSAADQPSSGEPKNQHSSTDSTGKGATNQPANTSRPTDNGRDKAQETPTSSENAEKFNKNAKTDEIQNAKPTHSESGESSSNRPSQSTPMDTSDSFSHASSSGTTPKPWMQPGPTHPIQALKKMENFSAEFNKNLTGCVMIDTTYLQQGVIVPYERTPVWDSQHVKLPHLYTRPQSHNKHYVPSRWEVTCHALHKLTKGTSSIGDVETAIMSYNHSYKGKWTFDALYRYGQRLHTMDNNLHLLIPKMVERALELPALIKRPIPLLRQQQYQAITMSQQQISCLLANAFFCTFPHRNDTKPGSEYANYPTINFSSLFANEKDPERIKQKAEKLRAIFHYFNTVTKESHDQESEKPDGLVTFERICIPEAKLPDWKKQKMPLRNLHISSEGSIEKEGTGMLQVDFACKYIGGGVLKSGLVQEEILFLMSPELIVARLFTEKLADNECLRITGPQMYNLTSGYSKTFTWEGPYNDRTKRDMWKRRYRQIVAIDALDFKNPKEQYTKENIKRELNKAFVGFSGNPKTAIATGNWGCGAFNGDPKLKAVIQLMAAAAAERDMAYFAFKNKHLAMEIQRMHEILKNYNITVDKLYKLLKDFGEQYTREHHSSTDLYRFIREKIGYKSCL
ncbi:hypothetical protein QQF64_001850 [Cirrhinus molitorella]|uniref:poly(ADP-ribose) glycohydrolase n=1 Tax=Cirrhinus molitorella TaxID=172907 RepID=A0ABR3MNG4_9TELE